LRIGHWENSCQANATSISSMTGRVIRLGPPASTYASCRARVLAGLPEQYSKSTAASSWHGSPGPLLSQSMTQSWPVVVIRTLSAQRSRCSRCSFVGSSSSSSRPQNSSWSCVSLSPRRVVRGNQLPEQLMPPRGPNWLGIQGTRRTVAEIPESVDPSTRTPTIPVPAHPHSQRPPGTPRSAGHQLLAPDGTAPLQHRCQSTSRAATPGPAPREMRLPAGQGFRRGRTGSRSRLRHA